MPPEVSPNPSPVTPPPPLPISPPIPPLMQMFPDKQALYRKLPVIILLILVLIATLILIRLVIDSKNPFTLGFPFIQTAATPAPTLMPVPTPVSIAPDERISMVTIGPDCVVTATTTKQTLSFKSGNTGQKSVCYSSQVIKTSYTGLFASYTELAGGTDEVISYYSLRTNSHSTLDNYGPKQIFDYEFLPNDHLVVLEGYRGAYDQQYLDIYDLPSIIKSSSAITHRRITLPNHDKDYSGLYFGDGHLEVSGSYNQVMEKYTTTQLLPISSCPCWYELTKTCSASDQCLLGQPKNL